MQPLSNHKNPKLEEWLLCQDPLTDKLCLALGEANLDLLAQSWVRPSCWDKHTAHIDDTLVFQREILMSSSSRIYWYARTLIPHRCFQLNPNFFNRLYHESMRELIYNEPLVVLQKRDVYPISALCIEYHWASRYWLDLPQQLWVRFTEFMFAETEPFYLVELLSPALGECI
jgi:hypothetical protein